MNHPVGHISNYQINIFNFPHFFDNLHWKLILATFDPLATPLCGTPPHHPPCYLHTCFLYARSPKNVLHYQILSGFAIFKVNGWYVDFCSFGAILANFGWLVS